MWYWLETIRYNWTHNSKSASLWDSIFEFVFKKKTVGIHKGDEGLGSALALTL